MPDGFGAPVGLNIFLGHLIARIENWKALPKAVGQRLLQYLDTRFDDTEKTVNTDLNILLGIYGDWLKTFPFDCRFFAHLKDRFHKKIPLLKGEIRTNKYMGASYSKMVTKSELVQYLVNVTKQILEALNSATLYEQGKLQDIDTVQVELLVKARKVELSQLTARYVNERKQYIKVIKQWFQGEQRFLKQLKPLLQTTTMSTASTPTNQITITGSQGVSVIIGNDNTNRLSYTVAPGNMPQLQQALRELQLADTDITELTGILATEKPAAAASQFGDRTKNWIQKVQRKFVSGAYDIGTGTMAGVLTQLLNQFFGIN